MPSVRAAARRSPPASASADAQPAGAQAPVDDRRHAASRLDRSFAIVAGRSRGAEPPASPGEERPAVDHEATRAILTALAEQLGMRVDRMVFRADDMSARLLADGGAEAMMHRGVIHLDRATFDATADSNARLLAHEAAHVAQRLLLAPAARAALPAAALEEAAEVEADSVADRFAAMGRVEPVRVPLPVEARAAKTSPGLAPASARKWTLDDKVNYLAQTVRGTDPESSRASSACCPMACSTG